MADGRTHVLVGMVAGGGAALYRGRDLPGPDLLVEAIGGVIGGYAGGKAPDILEPAIHSGIGNSAIAGRREPRLALASPRSKPGNVTAANGQQTIAVGASLPASIR